MQVTSTFHMAPNEVNIAIVEYLEKRDLINVQSIEMMIKGVPYFNEHNQITNSIEYNGVLVTLVPNEVLPSE